MLGDPKVYNLCNMTPSAAQRHLAHTAKSKWFKETQLGHSTTCGSSHFVRIVQNEEEILRCPPHHQLHIPSVCQIVSHRLCADANDEGRFSEVCLKCSLVFKLSFATHLEHHFLQSSQDLVGCLPPFQLKALKPPCSGWKFCIRMKTTWNSWCFRKRKDVKRRIFQGIKTSTSRPSFSHVSQRHPQAVFIIIANVTFGSNAAGVATDARLRNRESNIAAFG